MSDLEYLLLHAYQIHIVIILLSMLMLRSYSFITFGYSVGSICSVMMLSNTGLLVLGSFVCPPMGMGNPSSLLSGTGYHTCVLLSHSHTHSPYTLSIIIYHKHYIYMHIDIQRCREYQNLNNQTKRTPLIHPSSSGLLVTWAYLDQTTLPVCVTSPSSDTLTSSTVPFVITPNDVYVFDCGFFFTPNIGNLNVVFNSGCVMFAYLNRRPIGRMKRSCFGGLRVKLSPTKHTLFILRFQHFRLRLPERITSNISAQVIGFTFSRGTFHFPAFYLRFCFIIFVKTLEFFCCSLSIRQAGMAPSSIGQAFPFAFFYSCYFIVFFICIFCLNLSLLKIFALMPLRV